MVWSGPVQAGAAHEFNLVKKLFTLFSLVKPVTLKTLSISEKGFVKVPRCMCYHVVIIEKTMIKSYSKEKEGENSVGRFDRLVLTFTGVLGDQFLQK